MQAWSGLTRLAEVAERLRPGLRAFSTADGAELLDLPDAPRPDPDTPAPPRFLPEYDNLLFSHADRTRVIPDGHPIPLFPGNGGRCGTVLIDGTFRGTWRIAQGKNAGRPGHGGSDEGPVATATLLIEPFARLPARDRDALTAEGARLLTFLAGQESAHGDVEIRPVPS